MLLKQSPVAKGKIQIRFSEVIILFHYVFHFSKSVHCETYKFTMGIHYNITICEHLIEKILFVNNMPASLDILEI